MTDQDIIDIIAQGIVDGTDLGCTVNDQAREVLRQLRAAGVIVGANWTPPRDRPDGYRCLVSWGGDDWRTGEWTVHSGQGGVWCFADGSRTHDVMKAFAPLPITQEAPQ